MGQNSVEDIIIELLAEEQHTTAEELLQRLLAAGADLPIDSVLAAEIVASVQKRFGVRMPTTRAPEYLRSVRVFAAQVRALISNVDGEEARGA